MSIAPETKSADPAADASRAFDEFARAFEAFKETNDERLVADRDAALRRRRHRGEARPHRRRARRAQAPRRPRSRSTRAPPGARRRGRRRRAIRRSPSTRRRSTLYVRSGEAAGLKRLEEKALSAGSGPDGGYLVPADDRARGAAAPRGDLADPRHRLGARRSRAGSTSAPSRPPAPPAGWVGETAARPQTDAADARRAHLPGDGALRHAGGDADAARRRRRRHRRSGSPTEVETAFAEQEGAAFVNGDGVNKPKGFLASDTVDNGAWVWGKIGYVPTGVAGAFPAANPSDVLVDLVYALKAGYRQNGAS